MSTVTVYFTTITEQLLFQEVIVELLHDVVQNMSTALMIISAVTPAVTFQAEGTNLCGMVHYFDNTTMTSCKTKTMP